MGTRKIVIFNEDQLDMDSRLALTSHVVVQCVNGKGKIIKDRMGIAFNLSIEKLDNINAVLEAIYPEYELVDMRSAD